MFKFNRKMLMTSISLNVYNLKNTYRHRFLFPGPLNIQIDDSQLPRHALELINNIVQLKLRLDGNIN